MVWTNGTADIDITDSKEHMHVLASEDLVINIVLINIDSKYKLC